MKDKTSICRTKSLFIITVLFLFSNTAFANIATPLWKTNSVLFTELMRGLIEGLIVSFVFKTSIKRGILIMLFANYASALIGIWILDLGIIKPESMIYNYDYSQNVWTLKNTLFVYFATCFIELPFIMWACKNWKKGFFKMVIVCFLIQMLTYPIFLIHIGVLLHPKESPFPYIH